MTVTFVYNANGGALASVAGAIRKAAAPERHACNLCKITYPRARRDKEWKKFLASLPYKTAFLHRDEFRKRYADYKDTPLPAVFLKDNSGMRLIVSHEKLNEAKSVAELIELTKRALPQSAYTCSECGLRYPDPATAAKCRAWCKEHKSCNLDIIAHAIKEP